MEKYRSETRKSNIKLIILFISTIILSLIIITNYKIYHTEIKRSNELEKKLVKLVKNKDQNNERIEKIQEEINELNNIDNTIKNTKENVFKLATVLENKIINHETNYKIAYLTFDDGPYYLTNKVLDTLKEKGIKATFFTIGLDKDICYDNPNASCYDTYKKIVEAGHTIANHTYSHGINRGLYSNSSSFIYQLQLQQDLIETRTGTKTNIMRFPGGSGTARVRCPDYNNILTELKNRHYGWVDWTAADGDGGYLVSYDLGWNNFTSTINEDIEVVLFHDYNNVTASLLPNAIDYLENKNYILLPLFYESIKVNK